MKKREARMEAAEVVGCFLSNNKEALVDTFGLKAKKYEAGELTMISGKTEAGLKIKLNDEGTLKIYNDKDKILAMEMGKKIFHELSELIYDRDRNGINDTYEEARDTSDCEKTDYETEDDYGEALGEYDDAELGEDEYER
ncbi:hypothetical protein SAMN02910301_2228 [Lachnospiraceae bacterium XBD2001]|nr:hypothetical protein SAMN02910301_2228 [Lachnospiraceae bacterium XBD2001]